MLGHNTPVKTSAQGYTFSCIDPLIQSAWIWKPSLWQTIVYDLGQFTLSPSVLGSFLLWGSNGNNFIGFFLKKSCSMSLGEKLFLDNRTAGITWVCYLNKMNSQEDFCFLILS